MPNIYNRLQKPRYHFNVICPDLHDHPVLVEGLGRDRCGLQADLGHRDRRDHQGQNVHPLGGRVSGSLRKRTHGSGLKSQFPKSVLKDISKISSILIQKEITLEVLSFKKN